MRIKKIIHFRVSEVGTKSNKKNIYETRDEAWQASENYVLIESPYTSTDECHSWRLNRFNDDA